jgi:poly-gamma-glutamate synthesis protein (capsule biosynthesis protein)
VVGDIMLGRRVAAAHADPTVTLRALRPLLRRADLTVGNLESTLSTAGPPTQDDYFSAPPSVLRGLADAGFDALSLANNHTGDHGNEALLETVAAIERSPIVPFGAGRGVGQALRPAVLRSKGTSIGLLGFNAIGETPEAAPGTPGALSVSMPPRTGPLDRAELRRVLGAVRRLARRVDAVVVLPHWGEQYTHVAEPVQSLVGRRLVDAGAALVVGGHPHWVQGYERHRGGLILHSLGNAVFDMDFMAETMEGVVLTATFRDGRVVDAELTPYRMDAGFTPRPLRGAEARAVLDDVRRHSRGRLPSAGR